jgi:ACR3 family arsenite transporter
MVFVWSNLSTASRTSRCRQVALNDLIMVVAFAPIVGLLLGLSAITVPWDTLLLSVALYIVVPVRSRRSGAARCSPRGGGSGSPHLARLQPLRWRLLATLVLLFGFQGEQIMRQPLVIALLAVPILIQVYFNAGSRLLAQPRGSASRTASRGPRR